MNAVVLEFGKFMKIIVHFSEGVRLIQANSLMHLIFWNSLNYNYPGKEFHHVSKKGIKRISYIANSIIHAISWKGRAIYWKSDEVISSGTNLVKSLCEILYIVYWWSPLNYFWSWISDSCMFRRVPRLQYSRIIKTSNVTCGGFCIAKLNLKNTACSSCLSHYCITILIATCGSSLQGIKLP